MGDKSRGCYTGACIKECTNRDKKCDDCISFSHWELPEICTLLSIKSWVQREKDWRAYGRMTMVVDEHGAYKKVRRDEIMDMVKEDEL